MSQQFSATRLCAFGAIAASAALSGCASGYSTFYRPAPGVSAEVIAEQRAGSPGAPVVERLAPAAQPQQLLDAYEKRGYVLIGSSTFNSDQRESEADAIAQGLKVGADLVVILSPRQTGSTTVSVPLRAPASDRNRPVAAFGSNEFVNTRDNSMTRAPGAPDSYVAMAVHRTDFGAGYFIKQR